MKTIKIKILEMISSVVEENEPCSVVKVVSAGRSNQSIGISDTR